MMTKEDIIRMAHEAGLHLATDVNWMPIIDLKYAQKFAELVASAERSACAQVCDKWAQYGVPAIAAAAAEIRARRESNDAGQRD